MGYRDEHPKVLIFDWDDTICPSSFVDRCKVEQFDQLPVHVSQSTIWSWYAMPVDRMKALSLKPMITIDDYTREHLSDPFLPSFHLLVFGRPSDTKTVQ